MLSAAIAIPSHDRRDMLESKSLALLRRHGVPMAAVSVFVSPESHAAYRPLAESAGFSLVRSKRGITATRNHIIAHYPDGARVVEMDDDVDDIVRSATNRPVGDLVALLNESFDLLPGRGLWGLNATTNPFFADGRDKWGLYSVVNSCLGYYNDKRVALSVPEKEDFERCLLFYRAGLPILKRGAYGIRTKYWRNRGGIQSRYGFDERLQVQETAAQTLLRRYPTLCYAVRRKSGLVDVRFRRDPLKRFAHLPKTAPATLH